MPQSDVILGFLALGFVVYITAKGELRTYLGFFLGTPASSAATLAPSAGSSAGLSAQGSGVNVNTAINTISKIAPLLGF